MYIAVTGSKNNKDVYIYQSFRKKDGKSSSRIYKKLGKYNALLEQFDGDNEKLMAWAKSEAAKETDLYNERTGKVTVEFSQAACIPMNETRSFHAGYLFLQQFWPHPLKTCCDPSRILHTGRDASPLSAAAPPSASTALSACGFR